MLRITHSGYLKVAIIHLDGKLVGPWVDELRRTIESMGPQDAKRLNLANLAFADVAGLRLLQSLRSEGIDLVGAPPLIEALLASQPDVDLAQTESASRA